MEDDQIAALNPVLYICHLPTSLSQDELLSLILPFARPISIYLPLTDPCSNHGYAYISFPSFTDAQRTRKHLNGVSLRDCTLATSLYLETPPLESANVFVKNFPATFTPALLEDLFAPSSVILSSKISLDADNQSLGYGYVQFLDENMAGQAIRDLNGVRVGSRPITVESFVRKAKRTLGEGHSVFVKGFGPSLTEFHLQSIFSPFGVLKAVNLRRVPGFSFAFITFQHRSSAETAIRSMNGSEGPGFTWFCSFRVPPEGRSGCDLTRDSQWRQSRVLVTNFPVTFHEADLRKLFSPFGHIVAVKFGATATELGPVDAALVTYSTESEIEDAITWGKNIKVAGRTLRVERTTRDFPRNPLFPPFDLSEFYSQSEEEVKRECLEGYVRIAVERAVRKDRADWVALQMVRMGTEELVRVVSDGKEMERVVKELENREEGEGEGEAGFGGAREAGFGGVREAGYWGMREAGDGEQGERAIAGSRERATNTAVF